MAGAHTIDSGAVAARRLAIATAAAIFGAAPDDDAARFLLHSLFPPSLAEPGAMPITPEDVLAYSAPTEGFLCPLDANVWDVEFLAFKIRDAESGKVSGLRSPRGRGVGSARSSTLPPVRPGTGSVT